ncbi:unnamed protein product [Durusdinium trenchii]|uniref:Uncharacterized protein n=1 Tax=Durusdinium trenchii TaxID=1381693 RepID=A0ABP0QFP7_9DINO
MLCFREVTVPFNSREGQSRRSWAMADSEAPEASTRLLEAETKSSPPAEGAAQLCMVVIGIGYLFPIAAIWAAFDYWKLLFPDQNVEFAVTALYQAGSILTVIALSFVETFQFGPRILGGFGGQFLCLSAILAFKWLPWSPSILYDLLLGVVLLCSVATGYLDSALLSLCSQYSSKMQAYLQIGLGFGTLVSVAYRDVTKLVSSEVSVASTAFFVVALATVLVCISAYRLLMLLPASRHLSDAAPGASSYGAVSDTAKGSGAASGATVGAVLSVVWFNQLVIFGNFFLTTLCYPGLITAIPCKQMKSLDVDQWFQTILLTVSESLHCHLALAVEFRDCPSGACCCGPVVPTAPWSLLLKSGSAHCDQTLAVEGGGREKEDEELRRLSYKSGRPHLPGGEEAKSRKGCVLLSTILRELPNILSICGRVFVYFVKAWGWIAPNGSLTPSTQLKPMKEQLVGAGTTQ